MRKQIPAVALFYAARGVGLIIKPASLWFVARSGQAGVSTFLATYYFVVAATFIALNCEAHISYYRSRFGGAAPGANAAGTGFSRYLTDLSGHILVFLPLLGAAFALYFGDLWMAAAFTIFVLLEKLWDELQRDLIFSHQYTRWSVWFIVKMLAPVVAVAAHLYLGWNVLLCMTVASLLVASAVAWKVVPAAVRRVAAYAVQRACGMSLARYLKAYRNRFAIAQLVAVTSVNVVNTDKWLAPSLGDPRLLVELVLLAQFGAAFLVLIDNVFFSRNRSHYVRPKTSLTEITDWRLLLLLSVGYLACSAIVLREPFRSQLQLHTISLLQGMLVIGCSVLAGATRPLVEHAFWHAPRVWSAALDCAAIGLSVALGYTAVTNDSLTGLLLACLLAVAARWTGYWSICRISLARTLARANTGP